MKRLAALSALLCCATTGAGSGPCRTPCGMTAAGGDCESLQRFEGLAVRKLGALPGWSEELVCSSLSGWKIQIHQRSGADKQCSETSFHLAGDGGFCASGYTWQDTHEIELGSAEWRSSALAHEMCHVVDLAETGRLGHCFWSARRRAVLDYLRGIADRSTPEPDCFESVDEPDAG